MNKFINLMILATLSAAIAGCSVTKTSTKSNDNTIKGSQATKVENTTVNNVVPPTPIMPNPADAEPGPAISPVAIITMQTPLARNIGGEWTIVQVGSTVIDRDENMPYIIFQPSSASFFANNGCNTLNGAYSIDKDDVITFHNVLSTLRMCPDVNFDSEINAVVTENVPVKLRMSEVGAESFVEFLSEAGKPLMRLRRGNLQFLNGNWDVESISGLDKLDVPAHIFFDLAELRLNGNTGCNIVNGEIYLDHRHSNAVDFSKMGLTRMACPYDKQQTAMLVALEETASAISDGADKVMLLGSTGKVLMTLKRAPVDHYED